MEEKELVSSEIDDGKGKKLFVAGVSWNTTDDGFLNYFARFGDISEALVMRERNGRSRGFGFVTFKDAATIEKLQSQTLTLDGRKLDIMEAIPRGEMLNSTKPLPKKLYIAGVSWNTTDDGLFNFFSRYGTVVSAQIQRDRQTGRSRGFGFVSFEDASSAEKVLADQNLSLDGRRMEIKAAVPRGMVGQLEEQQRFASQRPKKVFVAGIADTVSEDELKEHFSQYGPITECYIQKDRTTGESRGFGFVSYENPDDVDKVLQKPSQKIGEKCVVDIKVARPKEAPAAAGRGAPGASVWSSTFGPGPSWGAPGGVGPTGWGGPPPAFGASAAGGWGAPFAPNLGFGRSGRGGLGGGAPGAGSFDGQYSYGTGAFRPAVPRRATFHPYQR